MRKLDEPLLSLELFDECQNFTSNELLFHRMNFGFILVFSRSITWTKFYSITKSSFSYQWSSISNNQIHLQTSSFVIIFLFFVLFDCFVFDLVFHNMLLRLIWIHRISLFYGGQICFNRNFVIFVRLNKRVKKRNHWFKRLLIIIHKYSQVPNNSTNRKKTSRVVLLSSQQRVLPCCDHLSVEQKKIVCFSLFENHNSCIC